MFNYSNNKKLAIWLMAVSVSCFAIAALLLFQIDIKGLNQSAQAQVYNVDEEKAFDIAGVDSIVLDTFSSDINIIPAEDDKIKIHIYGSMAEYEKDQPKPEIKLEGTTVYAVDKKNFSEHGKVQLFTFGYNGGQNELKMDVYLPIEYKGEMHASTSSGKFSSGDLNLSDFSINTFSGDVAAGSIKSIKAVFETSSGNIATDSISADDIRMKSFSGDIKTGVIDAQSLVFDTSSGNGTLGDVKSKTFKYTAFSGDVIIDTLKSENAEITASSGDIEVKGGNIDKIKYKTFSGDINGENTDAKDTYIDTSSGKVYISGLSGKLSGKSFSGDIKALFTINPSEITLKSSSGNVSLALPSDASFKLNAHSSSGRTKCDFPIQMAANGDRNEIIGTVGTGEGSITVDTFSGDIAVTK